MDSEHPIVRLIVEKGVDSVDLSMFDENTRKELYSQVAEILLRLNREEEYYVALSRAGHELPIEKIKRAAQDKMALGKYAEAYALLVNTGQEDLAECVKQNFLKE